MTHSLQDAVDALARAKGNKTEASRELKVPRSTYLGWLEEAKRLKIRTTIKSADVRVLEHAHKEEIRTLKAELKDAYEDGVTTAGIRKELFKLAAYEHRAPSWFKKSDHGEGQPGIPMLLLSDLHWGEVVKPEQVNNLNSFNMAIARQRLNHVIENCIDVAKNHMVNPDYPGMILMLGGDLLSGDLHEETTATNEVPTMVAMFDLFDHLVVGIKRLEAEFGNVCVFTTFGNHGRTTKKPPFKDAAHTNLDWVLCNMLERHFKAAGDKNVKFFNNESFDNYFRVYDTKFLLTHGDHLGTGGGGGVIGLLGPVYRGVQRVKATYSDLNQPVDIVVMGHWHQYISLIDEFIVNGSLKGYDEYAIGLRLKPQSPVQAMWFVHPAHGITFTTPIFTEGSILKSPERSWLSVSQMV